MSTKERIVRVVLSILLIGYGLLILNHSFYSFWVAGGPPNEYPNAWHHQGIASGWHSIALITIGVLIQFRWQQLKTSITTIIISIAVLVGVLYPYAKEQLLIDSCLDNGGVWSPKYFKCQN